MCWASVPPRLVVSLCFCFNSIYFVFGELFNHINSFLPDLRHWFTNSPTGKYEHSFTRLEVEGKVTGKEDKAEREIFWEKGEDG